MHPPNELPLDYRMSRGISASSTRCHRFRHSRYPRESLYRLNLDWREKPQQADARLTGAIRTLELRSHQYCTHQTQGPPLGILYVRLPDQEKDVSTPFIWPRPLGALPAFNPPKKSPKNRFLVACRVRATLEAFQKKLVGLPFTYVNDNVNTYDAPIIVTKR